MKLHELRDKIAQDTQFEVRVTQIMAQTHLIKCTNPLCNVHFKVEIPPVGDDITNYYGTSICMTTSLTLEEFALASTDTNIVADHLTQVDIDIKANEAANGTMARVKEDV